MTLFNILKFFAKGNKSLFDIEVETQKAFINHLGGPKNDFDRSYKQYQCQNIFIPKWKIYLFDFTFFFINPFLILYYLCKGIRVVFERHVEAIASMPLDMQLFPEEISEEYKIEDKQWSNTPTLRWKDLPFVLNLYRRGFFHPFFVGKCVSMVAIYSTMIHKFQPKALLAHCEFSFSCSLLTSFCQTNNVLHINTMHGEKLFVIRDAYVRFHRFYVWDIHYVALFTSMMGDEEQFIVFTPKSLTIDCSQYIDESFYADFKYYLAVFSESELQNIVDSMNRLIKRGATVAYRPHPRYSDLTLLRKYVPEELIEKPQEVSIQQSIANSKHAIGSYTTVLNQAACSDRGVVLDDVAFKEQYEKLQQVNYILTRKSSVRLSKLLNDFD